VGHAGTLDPAAEGVLPVCLGQATRVVEYLVDAKKTYVATARLGVETDTYDAEGNVVSTADAGGVTRAEVEAALDRFRGEIEQIPPRFSALKREGVPLYKLARLGHDIVAPARRVTIFRLEILSFEPPFVRIEVECSKGTYIRSLAHDLGAALGVGASLSALRRTRVGPFGIDTAVDIESLAAEFDAGTWSERLYALDEVLLDWPAAILGDENEDRLRHGRPPQMETNARARSPGVNRCRAYGLGGELLAVLQRTDAGEWRPAKVFQSGHQHGAAELTIHP
jgi:tRNA pseudouridine55 synthase